MRMNVDDYPGLRKIKEAYAQQAREARKYKKMSRLEIESKSKSDLISDKLISELVYLWTGKDGVEQRKIFARTPNGKQWAQVLAEESTDYMRQTALRMTDSGLIARLHDMRVLENLRSIFSDVLYEV